MVNQLQQLLQQLNSSIEKETFVKLTLGNKRLKNGELKNVFIKCVSVKNSVKLNFVYRYPTKDITKNFDLKEGLVLLDKMLENEFYNADFFTSENDFHFSIQKDIAKLVTKPASLVNKGSLHKHDKEKVRIVNAAEAIYLKELGITSADGIVKKDMQDKYKQINKYIEIIDGIVKDIKFKEPLQVVDMGSGKGYLTFALYDYLVYKLRLPAVVTGIEVREELVAKCNGIALNAQYKNLYFSAGTIEKAVLSGTDILIALHACDTATDEAIYSGIKAAAKVIICAPCCHKQIRNQMMPANELKTITKHGILLERQAEITTDAIRALLLEAHGYKTKVFEFIATEHTPKNVLIVGIKSAQHTTINKEFLQKVSSLKSLFGIKIHHLEILLKRL